MAENFAGRAGVFFDTSVWSPLDLLDLYRLVAPEQIVYASDYPYGRQPNSLLMAVRTARASGLDDAEMRGMLGGTAARSPTARAADPGAARGAAELSHPVPFLRIHQYLTMASAMLWMRQTPIPTASWGSRSTPATSARTSTGPRREQIRELLVATRDLWDLAAQIEDDGDRRRAQRGAFRLVHLANILAVTNPA